MRLFENERNKKIIVIQKKKILLFFFMTLLVCVVSYIYYATNFYKEELIKMCEIKNKNVYTKCVNDGLSKVLKEFDENIVNITYNNGLVSSIEYNTKTINTIRTQLIDYVINKIRNEKMLSHKIYYSDFMNIPFMINRGPSFTVNTYPVGSIDIECRSSFTEMGVNQTKNMVYFVVRTNVYTGTSSVNKEQELSYNVPIAETIIVGDVPETYTNVVTNSEDTRDCVLNLQ